MKLLQRAGVKLILTDVYDHMRSMLRERVELVLSRAVVFMEHAKRKTLMREDLDSALYSLGLRLAVGVNHNAKHTRSLQSLRISKKKESTPSDPKTSTKTSKNTAVNKTSGKKSGKNAASEAKKTVVKHKKRPGTRALQNIRFQQKHSDSLVIQKSNFERLVRDVAGKYHESVHFSGEDKFIDVLQLVCEKYLIMMSRKANQCTIHAKRQSISAKDFQLAQHLVAITMM